MNKTIIELHYDGEVHFDVHNLPPQLPSDAYLGLFEELYNRMMQDFFEFEDENDRLEISYSVLCDLHRLIDVYQLRRSDFSGEVKDLNMDVKDFHLEMECDDKNELTINFLGDISAQDIVLGLAILAGEILNSVDVNTMLVALLFDLLPQKEEEVIN